MDPLRRELERAARLDPESTDLARLQAQWRLRVDSVIEGRPLRTWFSEVGLWSHEGRGKAQGIIRSIGLGAVPGLLEQLRAESYWTRRRALEILIEQAEQSAFALPETALLQLSEDRSRDLRFRAARLLISRRFLSPEAVKALRGIALAERSLREAIEERLRHVSEG